ncbi:MAG: hypothetical protein HY700_13400 [Gemmatimonadetes bacterium]|nr:hypothetical protein [Gemmatimonadota bacterium]
MAPLVLRVPGSVRYAGLNGAGGALVGDAGSVFGNPAGLATIRHIALEGGFRPEPLRGHTVTAAAAWRLQQFDLGGGIQYLSVGMDPALGGTSRPHEALAVGSLVYRFGLLAAGVSAKWIGTTTGGVRQRAWGGDLGLAIAVFDIMAIGFSIQNVGGNFDAQSTLVLPRLTRLGFTMNYVDPQESFRLLSAVEVQWPEGRKARAVVGGEAGTVLRGVGLVGRLGYGSRWPEYQPSSVTWGGSVVLTRMIFDYSYEPSGLIGSRHRFGVRFTL